MWLAVVALAAGVMQHQREQTLKSQSREVILLATALADAIERGLQGAEGGLRALDAQRARRAAEQDEATALRQGADLIHLVRTLWIFDAARPGPRRVRSDAGAGLPHLCASLGTTGAGPRRAEPARTSTR